MTDVADGPPRVEAAGVPRARQLLSRARWAARAFAGYDHASVLRIAEAVTRVAEDRAEHYARWEVEETGCGVVADRSVTNRLSSRGILDAHRDHDHVTPRLDGARGTVELPRPAGVVLAFTPATNPVSALYATVIVSLLTRNAVVLGPHELATGCSVDAVRSLAAAAVAAGAPDGVIQVVERPSGPITEALTADERVDVVLTTAESGNVPVLVDATADVARAGATLGASKAFDNSVLRTNESVLVVEEAVADKMLKAMQRQGAHLLDLDERDRVRDAVFPRGRFDQSLVGRDAAEIAARAGVQVPAGTRILVAPFDLAVDEEPLAHEKPCPVLGVVRVPTTRRGIRTAAAVLRIGGAAHCAVIHSSDPRTVMDYAAALDVLRVVVNEGGSTGPPGEGLRPEQLVRVTRIDGGADASGGLSAFEGIDPWSAPSAPVPAYPVASNLVDGPPPGSLEGWGR